MVRPEVSAELAALVGKMMAKDPAARFQTPGDVAQALTPFFKGGNEAFKRGTGTSPRNRETTASEPASRVARCDR